MNDSKQDETAMTTFPLSWLYELNRSHPCEECIPHIGVLGLSMQKFFIKKDGPTPKHDVWLFIRRNIELFLSGPCQRLSCKNVKIDVDIFCRGVHSFLDLCQPEVTQVFEATRMIYNQLDNSTTLNKLGKTPQLSKMLYKVHWSAILSSHVIGKWKYCDKMIDRLCKADYAPKVRVNIGKNLAQYHKVLCTNITLPIFPEEIRIDQYDMYMLPWYPAPFCEIIKQNLTKVKLDQTNFNPSLVNSCTTSQELLMYAMTFMMNEDYSNARKTFEFLEQNDVKCYGESEEVQSLRRDFYLAYGIYYQKCARYQESCECFERIHQWRTMDAYFYFRYSLSLFKVKKFGLSLFYLRLARKIKPTLCAWGADGNKFYGLLKLFILKGFDFRQCSNTHCHQKSLPKVSSFKVCNGCQAVTYCSKKCQIADWESHKTRCVYVATKTLTADQSHVLHQLLDRVNI